jgi:hypothetical protein
MTTLKTNQNSNNYQQGAIEQRMTNGLSKTSNYDQLSM